MAGLQGSLKDFEITDILQLINMNKKDGCLEITTKDSVGRIYFEGGSVTHAEIDDRFGESAIHQILVINDGSFKFIPDVKTPRNTISLPIHHLMLEAARSIDEWKQIEKLIPSLDLVVKVVENPDVDTDNIKLSSEEWKMLTFVDNVSTIKEIAKKVNQSEFQTAKTIYGLITSGLITVEEKEGLDDILKEIDAQITDEKNDNENKKDEKVDDNNKKGGIKKFFSR
ncbi:MAG: DUF4388 domain-containing protein [candidate division WOR-3 bacterium]